MRSSVLMRRFLFSLAAISCLTSTSANASANDGHSLDGVGSDLPTSLEIEIESLESILQVHQTIVTMEQISSGPDTPRHQAQKKQLPLTLKKEHGKWGPSHTRHRLLDALHGFLKYSERQAAELARLKGLYKHVSKSQRKVLEHHINYSSKFDRIDKLLAQNQDLCDRIVHTALEFYGISMDELQKHIKDKEAKGQNADKVSVSQTLKHFVRDWTEEGLVERETPFQCILDTLTSIFPERESLDEPIKVLVPGAGLGRLGHDIASLRGFEVTINEWSMYMNIAYRFLEANRARHAQTLHPFIDSWSHQISETNMLRALPFPNANINASSVVLVEGDFTTAFRTGGSGVYDVIVTYFFIDTARNLMSYFDTIKMLLKPGGYWINLGPLLYGTSPFVQLTLEEILVVTEAMEFEYLDTTSLIAEHVCGSPTMPGDKVRSLEAAYGIDATALTRNAYNAQFWVARRV